MLAALGIDEFDERVYRVFLDRPDAPVAEVAAELNAPGGRVRHAAIRLEQQGLLLRVDGARYHPVGPQTVLTTLLHRHQAAAETAFAQVRATMDELAEVHRAGRLRTDPGGLVEVLSGREAVNRRVDELTRSISTHLWVLDKPPYLEYADGSPGDNESEERLTTEMVRRGVEVRALYCPEAMERPGRFATVLRLAAAGEQSRMLPSLPFKLRIMDRRVALVPLVGGIYDNLAVVHTSGLLDALLELFEAFWSRARPILDGPAPDDGPSADDLAVLRMLEAGLKDTAVARQLGISPRTATRRVSALLDRLGAHTRFQAGVEAARRGWV